MLTPNSYMRALALIAVAFILPGTATASAGKIVFVRGEVTIVNSSGEKGRVEAGAVVDEGDRIRTGDQARAQLRLSDGALIALRANSDYRILAQKTDEGLLEQAGKLFSGWMRVVTGAIADENPEAVNQHTPVATIGIRGTTYQVIHMPKGGLPDVAKSEPGSYIYLQQGALTTTAGGRDRFMDAGDVVHVPMDGEPPVPAPDKKALFSGEAERRTQAQQGELLTGFGTEGSGGDELLNDNLNVVFSNPAPFPEPGAQAVFFSSDGIERVATKPGTERMAVRADEPVLTYVEGTGDITTQPLALVANDGASPVNANTHWLASGERINWGVWQQGDYEAISNPDTNPSQLSINGAWQYMVGTNTLDTLAELDAVAPAGSRAYDFVGGTALRSSGGSAFNIASGSIGVNFDAGTMDITLDVAGITGTHDATGAPISSFYDNAGVFLSGGQNGGSIRGRFTGTNAEGVVSTVRLDEGTFYTGTAAFEHTGQ